MKHRHIKIIFIILFFFIESACDNSLNEKSTQGNPEVFDLSDRPEFVRDAAGDFHLCRPWNYDKPGNASRKYPLFVYLHGNGGSGEPSSMPCLVNDEDMTNYPCFVYVLHAPGAWDNSVLIHQINAVKSAFRIDTDRIYLMGYSMGGSGSYSLANAFYDNNNNQLFAAVVRMAGQSQTTVRNKIADKTSNYFKIESYKFR